MIADEATEEIREMLREMLSERFGDELKFGPIVVVPRVDMTAMTTYVRTSCLRGTEKLTRVDTEVV